MSAPDVDRQVMERFAALTGDAEVTIVLGAGASMPAGLPSWDELAGRLAVASGLVDSEGTARVLLSRQDPTIVLEAVRALSGEHWAEHLNTALYGGITDRLTPSPLHLAAAQHALSSPDARLGTLNFDTLLETAILSEGASVVVIGLDGRHDPATPTVHHLHGAVFDGRSFDPIVSFSDFTELAADDRAWQRRFFSDALARGPLLLAGTSYRDPDVRQWLHAITRDEAPAHQAFVTIVREGLGLDAETFDAIDDALVAEWEAMGMVALRMHDLTDVALVIRELRFARLPGYRTPTERVKQVWTAHTKQFRRLQDEYGGELRTDAREIARALGTSARRATLWLADGRGRLARWSTESTRFEGVRTLKRVPTGHDSPWIAGEAIGAEEVKLKDVVRDARITPSWRSVLAIPVFVGDGALPDIAAAVLTFGLAEDAASVWASQRSWTPTVKELSDRWGSRLSAIAFGS